MNLHVDFEYMVVKNENGQVTEPKHFDLEKVKDEFIAAFEDFAKIENYAREFFAISLFFT